MTPFRFGTRDGVPILTCELCGRDYELAQRPTLAKVNRWALEHLEFVHDQT